MGNVLNAVRTLVVLPGRPRAPLFDHLVGAGEQWIALFRLEAGELDHLSPLLAFLCDELSEVSGRAGKYLTTEFGHPCLHRRIGEGPVDLPVKPFDDLGRGAVCTENWIRLDAR